MGRKRIVGLDWLEPENTNQRIWALGYLRAKGFESLFHYREKILPNELPSHKEMLDAGMYIEQETAARELFGDMKDAWRQEKDRKKKKDSGRQVCAFTLSTITKTNLQIMAKEQKKSATALLESMITKAYAAHLRRQQKQQPKQTLQGDRHRTIQDLRKVLGGEVTQSDVSPMPGRGLIEESMNEPDLPEQKLGEHTSEAPDEKTTEHLIAPATLQTVEFPLEQKETNTTPLYPLHGSQTSAETAGEDPPEQAAPADLSPRPTDDFPQAQTDDQLPPMKIKLQKKKTFTLPTDRSPMLQVTDQSPPNTGSDEYTTE